MAAAHRPRYGDRMGIETILLVGFVILVLGVIVGLGRAKRRARRERENASRR